MPRTCKALTYDMHPRVKNLTDWLRLNSKLCAGRIVYTPIIQRDGIYLYSQCQRCKGASRYKIADIKMNRTGKILSVAPIVR